VAAASGVDPWPARRLAHRGHQDIHTQSRGTYGAPRVHAELRLGQGIRWGKKRVARLMCAAGLQGVHRRRTFRTMRRDETASPAPDLLNRDFGAQGPDRTWVADITYVPTWSGFLYLAVVLDAFSRKVVGWSMADHLRTELVLDSLNMAVWNRRSSSSSSTTPTAGARPGSIGGRNTALLGQQ
jgi:putative transposase